MDDYSAQDVEVKEDKEAKEFEESKKVKEAKEKLIESMKITSVCRFNASVRIAFLNKVSFLTTTIFSLGLILIPLLQMILKVNTYSSETLSVIQIFLAVSVLVYSTIIGTAKYDVRAKQLDNCGIDIKSIIRQLREGADIKTCRIQYDEVIKNCENHIRCDYWKAQLYLTEYFKIKNKYWYYIGIFIQEVLPYVFPIILVSLEIVFLLDLVGVTNIFTNYFK